MKDSGNVIRERIYHGRDSEYNKDNTIMGKRLTNKGNKSRPKAIRLLSPVHTCKFDKIGYFMPAISVRNIIVLC